MTKRMLVLVLVPTALLAIATVGLFAESKAEFSIVIRPVQSTVKVGSPVEVEVKKTNLSNRTLAIGNGFNPAGGSYSYDVRRDGVLVPETESAKEADRKRRDPHRDEGGGSMMDSSVPPHRTEKEMVSVNAYRDMSQPGKYTIQLQEGRVKSNVVTVTVEP